MQIHEIDFGSYCRPPRISASTGLMLTIRTLRAAPEDLPGHVHKQLLKIRARGESVQAVVRERARLRSRDLRPLDRGFDGSWAGFHARIQAYTRTASPKAPRAAELLAAYFPDGLIFLTAGYEEQWLYSRTLLQRFEAEGVEDELDELAGDDFLDGVREAHDELGEALGLGESEPDELPSLAPALNALAQAHADYGRLFAGIVDAEDPESLARFRAAMAPRDAHAAAARRRRGGEAEEAEEASEAEEAEQGDEELDVEEPLPPVPPMLG